MKNLLKVLIVVALLLAPRAALGAPITYSVNKSWPGIDFLQGTIQTDGTLGVITRDNILSWSLLAYVTDYDTPAYFLIESPWAYFAETGAPILRATETELYVDFGSSPPIGAIEIKQGFYDPWGGNHETYMGYRVQIFAAGLLGPDPVMVETFIYEHNQSVDRSTFFFQPTRLVIGTAAAPPSVPEPATLLLLGTGLGTVAVRRRRLKKRV